MPENENIIYDATMIEKIIEIFFVNILLLFNYCYDLPNWASELLDSLARCDSLLASGKP